MGKTVDERIVEMKFDNDQFEKNVNESITTIKNLKKELKFDKTSKELEELERASQRVSFKALMNSIDAVSVKMSALGVVGKTALEEITKSAMQMGKKIVNSVKDPIVQGGIRRAMNIEQAHFMLQGLISDEKEVEAVMKAASNSVDGTAYSYDSAAKAAAQFAATGIRSGEKLDHALAAIAGTTAMAGTEYERVADIFTTVSSNGKLMTMQLRQFSSMGLNVSATLAKYLNKTEAEINEMVTKSQISFETFSEAMNSAFGEHAKKANETFTGAMSNVKAALARIGAEFVSPLIEQNGEIVQFLNIVRVKINQIKSQIIPIAQFTTKAIKNIANNLGEQIKYINVRQIFTVLKKNLNTLYTMFRKLQVVLKPVGVAFRQIFPRVTLQTLEKLSDSLLQLVTSIKITTEQAVELRRAYAGIFAVFDSLAYIIKTALVTSFNTIIALIEIFAGDIFESSASIGDMLVAIRDWVKENDRLGNALRTVAYYILGTAIVLRDFIKQFKQIPAVQKADKVLRTFGQHMQKYLSGGIDVLLKFMERTSQLDGMTFENLQKAFEDFVTNVLGYFLDFDNAFDGLSESVNDLVASIESELLSLGVPVNEIKAAAKGMVDYLKGLAEKTKFENIFVAFVGIGTIKLFKDTSKALTQLLQPLNGVNKVCTTFAGTLQAFTKNIQAATVVNIAIAIGVLAGSLWVIAKIPSDQLWNAVLAMGALFGMLAIATAAISATAVSIGAINIVPMLISIAGVLVTLGLAIKEFIETLKVIDDLRSKDFDFDKNITALNKVIKELGLAFAGAMALSVIAVKLTKTLNPLVFVSLASVLIALGGALYLTCSALKELNDVKLENFDAFITTLATLLAGMAAVSFGARGLTRGAVLPILAIPASLWLMVEAFKKINELDIRKTKENIENFIYVFSAIGLLLIATRLGGANATKAGLGILAMSASLYLMIGAVAILGQMDKATIQRGTEAIAGLFFIMGITVSFAHFAGEHAGKSAAMIAMMGLALIECTVCIALLSLMDAEGVKRGVIALDALILAFGAAVALTGLAKDTDKIKKTLNRMIAVFALATLAIVAIVAMSNDNGKDAERAALSISIAMGALTGCLLILSNFAKVPIEKAVMKNLVELTGVFMIIGGVFIVMSATGVKGEDALKYAASISLSLVAMTVVMGILSTLQTNVVTASQSAIALAAFITVLGAVFGAIGGIINSIPGGKEAIMDALDTVIEIVEKIGAAIGAIIGGFVGEIVDSTLKKVANAGQYLNDFMKAAQPFFDGIKGVNPRIIGTMSSLFSALADLGKLNKQGGLAQFFGGKVDFKNFGEGMSAIAQGITDFVAKLQENGGFNDDKVEQINLAIKALRSIADLARDIPNTGGLIAEFVGDNDPAQWGIKIKWLAKGLVDFVNVLGGGGAPGIEGGAALPSNAYEIVENSCKCLYAITDLARDIPNTGGLIAEFVGDNDPKTWGEKLASLGASLVLYANTVDDLTPMQEKAMETAYKCMKKLADLGQMMTINTGLKKWLEGDNSFSKFGSSLTSFAGSMKTYADKIKTVKWLAVETSNTSLKNMVETFQTLSASQVDLGNIKDLSKSIKKISHPIKKIGESIKEFDEYTKEVDFAKVYTGMENVGKIVDTLSKLTSANIDENSVLSFTDALRELGAADYNGFLETFTGGYEEAFDVGKTFATNIFMGIDSEMISGIKNIKNQVVEMITAIKDKYSEFYSTGGYLMRGLAQGIKDNGDIAVKAAENVAKSVEKQTRTELKVESPSKKFIEIGKYVDGGLAKGIIDNTDTVTKSATALAKSTENAYREYMGIHSNSRRMKKDGKYTTGGLADGVKEGGKEVANEMVNVAKDSSDALSKELSKDGENVVTKITNFFGDAAKKVKEKGEEAYNNGKEKWSNVYDAFKQGDAAAVAKELGVTSDEAADSLNNLGDAAVNAGNKTNTSSKKIGNAAKNVKSAKDEYKEFFESIQNSLKSAGGLFEEFNKKQETSFSTMRLNLATQTAEISKWGDNIKKLGERGLSKGFLKYLSELGVQGASYVQELVNASDKELTEMQNLYSTNLSIKDDVAKEVAQTWKKAGKKASIAFEEGVNEGKNKKAKDEGKVPKGKTGYKSSLKNLKPTTDSFGAAMKVVTKAKDVVNYSLKDNINAVAKTMAYGSSVLKQFRKDFLVNTKNYKIGTKAVEVSKEAILNYGKKLYEKSAYYEEDQANLQYFKKQRSDLKKQRTKLKADITKAEKKGDKDRVKKLRAELKSVESAYKAAGKGIEAANDQIAEHTKMAFEETYASIKESIAEFVSSIPTEFDAGIDLFGDTELPISNQIEEAETELASLEEEQKTLMADIKKYYLATDEASKATLIELQKNLDSVNDKINTQRSTLESLRESESKYTSDKILDGMARNVNAVIEWRNNLKALSKTSISDGLLRELKEMGPQGAEYVKAFVNMTADELADANSIYAEKMNVNNDQLLSNFRDQLDMAKEWGEGLEQLSLMGLDENIIGQIQDMGIDGGLELMRQVLTMSSDQIADFNNTYAKSLKIPDKVTNQAVASMAYAGGLACKSFNDAMAKLYEDGTDENQAYKDNVKEIQKIFDDATKNMGKSGANKVTKEITKTLGLKKKDVNKSGKNIGKAIVDGMAKGVKESVGEVNNAGSFLATAIEATVNKKLGIKSPSRVFAQIGKFVDQGFAKGVTDNAALMTNSVENAANNTIDAINEIVEKGSEQPTIRPVMDLTEIQNGVDTINSMGSDLGVSSSYNFAKQTMDSFNASTGMNYTLEAINRLQATLDNMGAMRPNITENNTFNIEDATDPRAVANEVNVILQQQLERRSAVWA